jgi:TPP-dependent pyruvate/acetoin dehydrogenase alpha subunit
MRKVVVLPQLSVCFFGDGTTNIGAFHEALNFAVVWKLPVIFVCENNLYMEYTPIADVTAVPHPAADRAAAYELPRIVVDGNDADVVYRTALSAYDKAHAGDGPSLIECMTYRYSGHSRADPAKYRPEGELEKWKERDPIKIYRERLRQFGVAEETILGGQELFLMLGVRDRVAIANRPSVTVSEKSMCVRQ